MSTALTSRELDHLIFTIRGHRVMLDSDLAKLYGVTTKRFNEQVTRNKERFPEDFRFQLTQKEFDDLRSQFATSSLHGGRRYSPYVFTEHGALMAANVLKSKRAITISVQVVRAFVKLRTLALSIEEIARKVRKLESKDQQQDEHIKMIYEVIQELMTPPKEPKRKIGFHSH